MDKSKIKTMSDSDDDYEFPPLQLTKYTCSEEKKVVLDPSVTPAQQQKDADLDIKIAERTKDTEHRPYTHASSNIDPCIEAFTPKLQQPVIQHIKSIHPHRTTFISKEFCCLFNQDSLSIQDFSFPREPFTDSLCCMSSRELHDCICRHQLKRPFSSDAVLHPLCQYLFLLMSVHRDERTAHACSSTLHYIKEDWYPSLDIILIVFINWGINPELLNICDTEVDSSFPLTLTKKLVSSPRFEDNNVEKVLELIHSVAAALGRESAQDKLNKLLQILVLSALDEGFKLPTLQSCFSRCIRALLNAIPESQWNEHRVWTVCQMLHRNGTEHFHNQAVVCCSLLIVSPRAIETAKALAFATLNHILATELKTESLDSIADTSITELLMYYHPMNKLNSYVLYIVIKLVDFCVLRALTEDNLSLGNLNFMMSWLSDLRVRISGASEFDTTALMDLLTRCFSSWQIMKDEVHAKLTDGDAVSPLSSDITE